MSNELGPHWQLGKERNKSKEALSSHGGVSRLLGCPTPSVSLLSNTGRACGWLPDGRGHGQHDCYRVRESPARLEEVSQHVDGGLRPGALNDGQGSPYLRLRTSDEMKQGSQPCT